mgnify:CR=1 FL=1
MKTFFENSNETFREKNEKLIKKTQQIYNKIEIMKTYILIFICLILVGCYIFFGYYYNTIIFEKSKLRKTIKTKCFILGLNTELQDCYIFTDCSCGCSNMNCNPYTNIVGNNGECCYGKCCTQECCVPCQRYRQVCLESDSCYTENYIDQCCYTECCQKSFKKCFVKWGTCWNFNISVQIKDYENNIFISQDLHRECSYNNYNCANNMQDIFKNGNVLTCWFNIHDKSIQFNNSFNVEFIGECIWIIFGIILYIGILYYCLIDNCYLFSLSSLESCCFWT